MFVIETGQEESDSDPILELTYFDLRCYVVFNDP